MDQQNFQAIRAGTTVITANRRLFRALNDQFDQICLAAGARAWEPPAILPWNGWMESMWERVAFGAVGTPTPLLLHEFEEQLIWESVIADSDVADGLLQLTTTARAARDSWELQHAWRISDEAIASARHRDVRVFYGWAMAFREHCDLRGWLDHGRLADQLVVRIANGALSVPGPIWLAGFTEYSPQQLSLFAALEEAGAAISPYPSSIDDARVQRLVFADTPGEMAGVATWVATELERDANVKIGIVVPQLRSVKAELIRIFDEILVPGSVLPGRAHDQRPYDVSLGDPLNEQPLIDTALRVLQITAGPLPVDEMGALLRSPFLDGAELEFTSRASLDADLRRQRCHEWSLQSLVNRLQKPQTRHDCNTAHQIFERIIGICKDKMGRDVPSAWAEHFADVLAAAGWPGSRSLNATEHQVLEQWRRVIDTFATLDRVSSPVGRREAINLLVRIAARQIFQIHTPDLPVQVLGPLEAIGQHFERLWIMNLHDEVWPEQASPTPFLPIELQRELGIPHASAERQLAYARRVLGLLFRTAPQALVSHPRNENDRELRSSRLISVYDLTSAAAVNAVPSPNYGQTIFAAQTLQFLEDMEASEIAPGSLVRGGVSLLRDQALCPFRAFANHRLRARALERPGAGLEPWERGQLVHQALHFFWAGLKGHAQLTGLDAQARAGAIEFAVRHAVAEFKGRRSELFAECFTELEHARVAALLSEWLEVDLARPSFSVTAVELKHDATVADIRLRTQIDRIDSDAGGDSFIIDYKTGNPKNTRIANWGGERPEDPQLPLYALTANAEVGGVLFARVSKGMCAYVGYSSSGTNVPGVIALTSEQWSEQLAVWREVLENLSSQYRRGDARVAPKSRHVCDICDLHTLCRIHEQSSVGEEVSHGQ